MKDQFKKLLTHSTSDTSISVLLVLNKSNKLSRSFCIPSVVFVLYLVTVDLKVFISLTIQVSKFNTSFLLILLYFQYIAQISKISLSLINCHETEVNISLIAVLTIEKSASDKSI